MSGITGQSYEMLIISSEIELNLWRVVDIANIRSIGHLGPTHLDRPNGKGTSISISGEATMPRSLGVSDAADPLRVERKMVVFLTKTGNSIHVFARCLGEQ
jgi:hypothetical protein